MKSTHIFSYQSFWNRLQNLYCIMKILKDFIRKRLWKINGKCAFLVCSYGHQNSGSPETEDESHKIEKFSTAVVVKLKYKFLHLKKKRKLKLFSDSQTGCMSLLLDYGPLPSSSRILTCTLPGVGLFWGGSSIGKVSMTDTAPKSSELLLLMHFSSMSLSLS